jgi:SAM-dependent methyltransferase
MSTRWSGSDTPRGDAYDARFERLAETGADVHGEATLVEALLTENGLGRRVLDAGCGTGRVTIELARRGYEVTGVDLDPSMLDAAHRKAPDLDWRSADLVELDLGTHFDAIVAAGNVLVFLAPGTEGVVLERLATHLDPGGLLIAGFQLDRGLEAERYDTLADAAGLEARARYATWDREPWAGGEYAVFVHARR